MDAQSVMIASVVVVTVVVGGVLVRRIKLSAEDKKEAGDLDWDETLE